MWVYIGCFVYTSKEFIVLYLYFITNCWTERNQSKNLYEIIFKVAQQFDEITERTVRFRLYIYIFPCKLQMILQPTLCLGWGGNEGNHESSIVFHFKLN